jgi:hypothetical protein
MLHRDPDLGGLLQFCKFAIDHSQDRATFDSMKFGRLNEATGRLTKEKEERFVTVLQMKGIVISITSQL